MRKHLKAARFWRAARLPAYVMLLYVGLQSKKCNKGKTTPPPPSGPMKVVTCYTGNYQRYNPGTHCVAAPQFGSDPDLYPGDNNFFYTSAFNQKHYTTVKLQWSTDANPYWEYLWDSGKPLEIQIPRQIPFGKKLLVLFYSKEKCSTCHGSDPRGGTQRSEWIETVSLSPGAEPNVINFSPRWKNAAPDAYCY